MIQSPLWLLVIGIDHFYRMEPEEEEEEECDYPYYSAVGRAVSTTRLESAGVAPI